MLTRQQSPCRKNRLLAATWLALGLLMTGCVRDLATDDATSAKKNDAGPPEVARYCEDSADMFCGFYLRCDRIDEPDMDACQRTFVETCEHLYEPRYQALADRGLLQLSAQGLTDCRQLLQQVACDQQLMDLDGPCASIWQGTVPAGGACGVGVESFVCAPGTTCVVDLSLCGTCQLAAKVGDSCGDDLRCVFPALCVDGACVAAALPGEICGAEQRCISGARCTGGVCQARQFVRPGESCDAQHRCVYRSSCVQGTCRRDALLGEGCSEVRRCTSGDCGAQGLCQPLGLDGDSCEDDAQCLSASCSQQRCAEPISACLDP